MTKGLSMRTLGREQARRRFEELRNSGFEAPSGLSGRLLEIRQEILEVSNQVADAAEIYKDRRIGMALYLCLPPPVITLRGAADDGIWRFLSLDVLPDVVYMRSPSGREEWFWNSKWRIWLKRIWWWIHLSWQGGEEKTLEVLSGWTTDTVAQFIERSGKGFRVELWRRIAAESAERRVSESHFRRVMKLNTALLTSVEPTVSEETMIAYVEHLFSVTEGRG